MRFPKLPGRSDADTTPGSEAPSARQQTGMSTVPMPEQTPPPLTSELTRSIRFTISEPQGYFFEQVETFVAQVVEVLDYYEQIDYRWRQTVYEMQVESDQQAFDNQRLRSEIELFKVQGSPLVNNDGSYVTESQQGAFESVSADLVALRDQLSASEHARITGTEETNRLQDLVAMQEQEIAALRAWGTQVIADMQSMQGHSEGLEAHIAALDAQILSLTTAQAAQVTPPAPYAPPVVEQHVVPVAPVVVPVEPDVVPVVAPVATHTIPEAVKVVDEPVAEVSVPDLSDFDFPDVMPEISVPDGQTYEAADEDVQLVVPVAPIPVAWPSEGVAVPTEPTYVEPVYTEPQGEAAVVVPVPEATYSYDDTDDTYEAPVEAEQGGWVPEATDAYDASFDLPEVAIPVTDYATDEPAPATEADLSPAPVEDLYDPETAVDADDSTYGYTDDDEDDDDSVPTAWSPDSELAEGVALPGTGEAAVTYPPAAPGVPLETYGVPMEMWAPELDPKIQEMVRNQQGSAQPAQPVEPSLNEEADPDQQ